MASNFTPKKKTSDDKKVWVVVGVILPLLLISIGLGIYSHFKKPRRIKRIIVQKQKEDYSKVAEKDIEDLKKAEDYIKQAQEMMRRMRLSKDKKDESRWAEKAYSLLEKAHKIYWEKMEKYLKDDDPKSEEDFGWIRAKITKINRLMYLCREKTQLNYYDDESLTSN